MPPSACQAVQNFAMILLVASIFKSPIIFVSRRDRKGSVMFELASRELFQSQP